MSAVAGDARLSAARRRAELERALGGDAIDLLVVGGGITGAGVALDAATRGLRTVLVEAHDLAYGTSRWSSKMVHGGLRYLATGDVGVAYESAVERRRLLRMAPHLVRPVPFMLPLLPSVPRRKAAEIGAGFLLGDVLRRAARTPSTELPRPRRLGRAAALALAPGLPADGLRGGLMLHDGQLTDDARLVVAVARTAAAHGASVLTRVRATAIGEAGVTLRDELGGGEAQVRPRAVVNATGVWAAGLAPGLELRPSRGTHVVLDGAALPGLRAMLTLPFPGERNRYLLVLPQPGGRIYLGLTDEAVDEIDDVPAPPAEEVDALVGGLGALLGRPVAPAHVLGAFAGLRPLLAGGRAAAGGRTADLSRRHAVVRGEHRAVHVVGGKLTTFRAMAEDAVDAAVAHAGLRAGPCRTRALPLVGAAPRVRLAALGDPLRVARYGTEAAVITAWERERPALAEAVAPGVPVTRAELRFAVEREGALEAGDLLDRRFRIGFVAADRAAAEPAAREALAAQT